MNSKSPSLTQDKIEKLFPFYFAIDKSFIIQNAGASIKKLIPAIENQAFSNVFSFKQPRNIQLTITSVLQNTNRVIILESKTKDIILFRGQIIHLETEQQLLFVGSPWITDSDDLTRLNLLLKDFAIHDSSTEMVQIIKAKDVMMNDVKNLVSTLNAQKYDLIKAKEQAEYSRKAKESFLANMSHEIRTPLNAILGFSDILKSSSLSKDQSELVNTILIAGESLLTLINDILDLTKIESGNMVLEKIPINISDVVSNVQKLLTIKADEKTLALQFSISDTVPRWVKGDSVRLTQILVNLIGNAIKFTEKGTISTNIRVMHQIDDGYEIEFTISDTGVGIPEDKLHAIFDRFVQAEDQTTRRFGGTGLGLNITKMLVKLFGGKISCESTIGKGTTFSIQIPFEKAKAPIQDTQKFDSLRLPEGIKILLVEDNRMNQLLATKILVRLGATLDIADHGLIAIEMLDKSSYDLILMDIQMPEMDGYTTTKYIREKLQLRTPIIAMTANALPGEKAKCITVGMNDYFYKPYKAHELIAKIKEAMALQSSETEL